MTRVFLSHAYRDRDLASAIGRALSNVGVKVFDSTADLRPGENWRQTIISAIEAADAVIVVVGSPDDAASSWVNYEVGVAEAKGKPIVVMASETYPLSDVPVDLASYVTMTFDPSAPDAAAHSILRILPASA